MLSIKKINAGSGYEYFTRSIAHGDADYYLHGSQAGDPPGVWAGRGAQALGVTGEASEQQVRNLYGLGLHPDDDQHPLGAAFAGPSSVLERIRAWEATHPDAPPEERAAAVAAERLRGNRNSISALDLTFSPPKSWSVLWAAVTPLERRQMWAAHHTAIDTAVQYLQTHAAFTRTGHDGVRQVGTGGLTAVRFDHTTSRAGDVQPHSHLLVSTKVQGVDGKWRALDTAQVYAVLAAAGAVYSTVRDTETARALGTEHQLRQDLKEREVRGVPEQLRREYSGRRAGIETELARLVQAWEDRHGTLPPPAVRARMSEHATLRTRPGKRRGESVEQMLQRMQRRAGAAGFAFDRVREAAIGRTPGPDLGKFREPSESGPTPAELVLESLDAVTAERTTWTRWHLARAIENRQRIDPALRPEEILHRVEALTDAGLAHPDVRRISAPELLAVPVELRRRIDDASVFARHGSTVYTTQGLLDAERVLLDAGRRRTGITVPAHVVDQVLAEHAAGGTPLDAGQAAAVRRFVGEDRALDVLEGPAGSGKSRAMRAVVDAWTATGRDVLGLALSQQAARVLAEESGARTENIAKFLHHHAAVHAEEEAGTAPAAGAGRSGPVRPRVTDRPGDGGRRRRRKEAVRPRAGAERERWTLTPGQLVLVDEAAMADTRRMAELARIAARAGAVVRAVGDDAQITSPEAGGWFSLVADDVAALRLDQLHRFSEPWEAQATLRLRAGDPAVLATYAAHGRLVAGDLETLRTAAYNAWSDDERAGRTSLLLVGTNALAAQLSAQARVDLVTLGRVEPGGVELHDGNLAGRGDRVVTRLNDSRLRDDDGRQVANRDHWVVRHRHLSGRLTVERLDDATARPTGRLLELPPAYVAASVELAYAAVTAGKQGATVDTTHGLVEEHTDLSTLYVTATRGRHANTLYVETQRSGIEDQRLADTPEAVLGRILAAGRAARRHSAHQGLRDAQNAATSLAVLGPVWDDTATAAHADQVAGILAGIAPEIADSARTDPAWPSLLATARDAHDRGWDLERLLPAAVAERDLADATGTAKVLSWRLHRIIGDLDGRLPEVPGGVPLPRPTLPRPPGDDPHNGVAWPSYRDRTPPETGRPSPELVVARQAAELLDARVEALREELAADPPDWATRAFGDVPDHPLDRIGWTRRAAAVAAYRERYGRAGAGDPPASHPTATSRADEPGADADVEDLGARLLGPRPHANRREALELWEHAHRALGDASELTRLRGAGEDDLRAAVARADAQREQRPPYVGDDLRDAALRLRGARAADARLRGQIDLTAGQLAQLTRRTRGTAAARHALERELQDLRQELATREPRTAAAADRYTAAAAADQRWQDWERRTAGDRHTGRLAAEVLTSRVTSSRPGRQRSAGGLAGRLAAERAATARAAARGRTAESARRAQQDRLWQEQHHALRTDAQRVRADRPGPAR